MTTFNAAIAIMASMIAYTSGSTSYNSNTELCCNGTVLPKGTDDGCCGQKTYAYNKFLCCNEELFPIDGNVNLTCCTDADTGLTELYDYYTQECCAGKAFDRPVKDVYYRCCKDNIYDYDTQACCNNKVMDKKDDQECCDDKLYDYNTHLCCGKTVIEKDNGQACCNDELYDTTSKVCCLEYDYTNYQYNHEFIDLVGKASECCNGVAFDPNENICCNGAILGIPQGLDNKYDASCCGEVAYDQNKQACCIEYVNVDENSETETKFNIVDIVGERDMCCGHELYDTRTEICCNSTASEVSRLPEDREEDGYYKCCGKGMVYNTKNQVCVGGSLKDQSVTGNLNVCGDELMDYDTQSCCYDTIYDDNGPLRCCHQTMELYNPDEEMWCEGEQELVKISDEDKSLGNDACCSVRYY